MKIKNSFGHVFYFDTLPCTGEFFSSKHHENLGTGGFKIRKIE